MLMISAVEDQKHPDDRVCDGVWDRSFVARKLHSASHKTIAATAMCISGFLGSVQPRNSHYNRQLHAYTTKPRDRPTFRVQSPGRLRNRGPPTAPPNCRRSQVL